LLDEIEKAHPRILDVFLQVFDEGILTDSHGRKCSFKDALIIMTSNLGTAVNKAKMGFAVEGQKTKGEGEAFAESVILAVRKSLRPELLNRITQVIPFMPLDQESVKKIVCRLVERFNAQLASQNVSVTLEDEAIELLLRKGYSKEFGARAMERVFEEEISKPIAELILHEGPKLPKVLLVGFAEGRIRFGALG
jgi:hypothetical protein